MGAAFDSFLMTMTIAGPIALFILAWSSFTRLIRKPKDRGFFQRFPLFLPAVTFVISVVIIAQIGILPMAEYRGTNVLTDTVTSGEVLRFNVFEAEIVYSEQVQVILDNYLIPGESMIVTVNFLQQDTIVQSFTANLTSIEEEGRVTEQRYLSLDPGSYIVSVNHTFYEYGVPDETLHWLGLTISQPMKSSFIPELTDWTTLQFGLNVGCFFLILGGICIGGPEKVRYDEREDIQEVQTDYGEGGPEYGKGC